MKLAGLKALLRQNEGKNVRLVLPDGDPVPSEFHVTEVGHVVKRFVDCGGTLRRAESCLLQAWVGDDREHRLSAGKLAKILDLGAAVVPSEDLEVEVEYQPCCVAQYRIGDGTAAGDELRLQLAHKQTDCLAREACGLSPDGPAAGCGCGAQGGGC